MKKIPIVFFLFALLTRMSLLGYNLYCGTVSLLEAPQILFFGILFDLRPTLVLLLATLLLERILPKRGHTIVLFAALFLCTFQFFAEWFFWIDMDCRFNFIAVDYLIYTREVVNNILQSYPMKTICALIGLITIGTLILTRRYLPNPIIPRWRFLLPAMATLFILPLERWSNNNFAQELSENGTSNLLYAFFHNQLNYNQFYPQLTDDKVFSSLQNYLPKLEPTAHIDPIARVIPAFQPEKSLNVVLLTVESLSQEFLDQGWTPFINLMEKESISLKDHYATGTRTVRGLEALTLSVPPTPGSSIVRRPHHENLFSISSVLKPKGYEMLFWYGGYGYFDNMNAFFANNGFQVKDRLNIPSEKVEHETIWGVSDEHLFDAFLEDVKEKTAPFFALIMTTSNHRPYTFPENRIDMPMGSRESAVRYTDWALEQFFKKARTQPWFSNTLFIITADHCASSAGKLSVDPQKYHTPCLFYAPGYLTPKTITTRTSQIDVVPTLLGLLGIEYTSRFYGIDQIHTPLDRPVPLGTYQKLGFFGKEHFVILAPKKPPLLYRIENQNFIETPVSEHPAIHQAISVYQNAYERYNNHLMDAFIEKK